VWDVLQVGLGSVAATNGCRLSRRAVLCAGASVLPCLLPLRPVGAQEGGNGGENGRAFSFERLIERTRQLAREGYQPPPTVREDLAQIPLPLHQRIRARPEAFLWPDSPSYRVAFVFPGSIYREPVTVNLVEGGFAHPVAMRADMFDLEPFETPPENIDGAGFAGFRVRYPIQDPNVFDELLTFLGSSYFRAAARGTSFGASARGLALDTGLGRPEEFPAFREFWIQQPGAPFDPLTIYALLDSPSVAGAFRFDVVVREHTRIDVDANLFFRSDVEQVGVAPLSSMFFFGPNDRGGVDDYRTAAHNSQGLSLWTGKGEILWRAVVNPSELRMSIFTDENPRGFGLLQRTRDPAAFQDIAAGFARRPNLWVEPRGTWGKGSVRLIEVPTSTQENQNIAAFWTPAEPVRAGQELRLAYTLLWSLNPPIDTGLASVQATRIGAARGPGGEARASARRVVVDFHPTPDLAEVKAAELKASITAGNSQATPPVLEDNPVNGGWRLSFDVEPTGNGPVELRAVLSAGERQVSESWLYRLDKS
jgi:periplasmic glucans biosynthesis protein